MYTSSSCSLCLSVSPSQIVKTAETAVARQGLGEHVPAARNGKLSAASSSHFSTSGRMWVIKIRRQLSSLSSPRGLNRFPRELSNYYNELSISICASGKPSFAKYDHWHWKLISRKRRFMKAEESNTSLCISQVLTSQHICRLCWESFWNLINSNIKVHVNYFTVTSYLPLAWNGSSILVDVDEFLTISRLMRSQNSDACHSVWSLLQFRQSKLPLEGCYFAKRFTKENRYLQVGVQFSVLSDVSGNRKVLQPLVITKRMEAFHLHFQN
jgi:hypothetical protein